MKAITILLCKELNFLLGKAQQAVVLTVASLLLLVSVTSVAGPYTSLNVFGDSLSDSGALAILSPGDCPPPPYFDCRFSNGPVWAEILAADLGVSAATAYGGGTNWAIGGQRTDQVLDAQVPNYLGTTAGAADPDALYVIWAGGNDFLQNDPPGTYNPLTAVDNIINSILGLSAAGAMDFLIPNLPIADPWAFDFNALLAAGLDLLGGGLNITQFDAFGLFLDMTLNPGDYGFTNVTDPCFNGVTACANPDEYLQWDLNNPTAAAHEFIAAAARIALIPEPIPEPATLVLFGIGLAGLGWSRRKQHS
jgi:phospholipase/lecithinase/hemolysin